MTLKDLHAHFFRYHLTPTGAVLAAVETLREAQGVMFFCPRCLVNTGHWLTTHPILCWFPGVPVTVWKEPTRWQRSGSGYGDLRLSPSIKAPCGWHGMVVDGDVVTVPA